MELTPEQQTKCDLLGIDLVYGSRHIHYVKGGRYEGWLVRRKNSWLLVPAGKQDAESWDTADEAIRAATNPEKYGASWGVD